MKSTGIAVLLMAGSILLLAASGLASAAASPSTSTFTIQTSAPAVNFAGVTETYVIQASVPVASWWVESGSNVLLTYTSGSQQATVQLSHGTGADAISIQANATGYSPQWQNWTLETYDLPYISSEPSFTVVPGTYYNYTITNGSVGGTFTFTGAPYLTLHSAAGGVHYLSGTATSGTYTNVLTDNATTGNYTQAWPVSDGTIPASVSFSCYVGHHSISATIAISTVADGCGNEGVFSSSGITFQPVHDNNTMSYTLSDSPVTGYYAYAVTTASASSLPYTGIRGWFYGQPGSTIQIAWNQGGSTYSTLPSSGWVNATYTPGKVQTAPGGGGCGTSCGGSGGGSGNNTTVVVTHGFSVILNGVLVIGLVLLLVGFIVAITYRPMAVGGLLLVLIGVVLVFASQWV